MPDIEELRKWKVEQLKFWLVKHGLKRSGSKEVLIKRVYRANQNLVDSDFSDSSSDDSLDENRTCVHFLSWIVRSGMWHIATVYLVSSREMLNITICIPKIHCRENVPNFRDT